MFTLLETKKYIKDLKKSRLNVLQNVKLNIYLQALKNGNKLDPAARCKKLHGKWFGYYEVTLGWDLRLIYKMNEQNLELVRIGTHNQLFRSA